jgi:plasmid stabilization system protein ParE
VKSNPAAAQRVARGILDSCRRAGLGPETGRVRAELGDGIRMKIVHRYPYNVFYLYLILAATSQRTEPVPIVRVLHQRRKLDRATFEAP